MYKNTDCNEIYARKCQTYSKLWVFIIQRVEASIVKNCWKETAFMPLNIAQAKPKQPPFQCAGSDQMHPQCV